MKCKLLDVPCHALNWLLGLPWYVHALALLAVALLVWVLYDKIKGTALRIIKWGGWRAGVAALLGVIAFAAAFWPRKRKPPTHAETEHVPTGLDALLPLGKPSHKPRKYDPDTNTWK